MRCKDCKGSGRIELLLSTVDCDCVTTAREDAAELEAVVTTRDFWSRARVKYAGARMSVAKPFCCDPGCAADPEWWQGSGDHDYAHWCDEHLPELEPGERRHRLDGKPFAGEMVPVLIGDDGSARHALTGQALAIDPGTGDVSFVTVAKSKDFGCVEVDSFEVRLRSFDRWMDAMVKALAKTTGIPERFLRGKE